jgi:hypothetical protein
MVPRDAGRVAGQLRVAALCTSLFAFSQALLIVEEAQAIPLLPSRALRGLPADVKIDAMRAPNAADPISIPSGEGEGGGYDGSWTSVELPSVTSGSDNPGPQGPGRLPRSGFGQPAPQGARAEHAGTSDAQTPARPPDPAPPPPTHTPEPSSLLLLGGALLGGSLILRGRKRS